MNLALSLDSYPDPAPNLDMRPDLAPNLDHTDLLNDPNLILVQLLLTIIRIQIQKEILKISSELPFCLVCGATGDALTSSDLKTMHDFISTVNSIYN